MSEPTEWETEGTGDVVCPWCGSEHRDSWEFFDARDVDGDRTSIDCGNCEKRFVVTLHIEASYSTRKAVSDV